jgi:alditol oxidase
MPFSAISLHLAAGCIPSTGLDASGFVCDCGAGTIAADQSDILPVERLSMTSEHNWADNYTFSATHLHRPVSVDEARRIVTRASRIRAIGARHSFNGIADSPGDLIDLGGIDSAFVIDREQQTVTVGAGTNYGTLAIHLQQEGWALHNMAVLPHVTIAGAIATGTHGSGDGLGSLATAVSGLEIILATGDILSMRRGDPNFDGIVVGLGALGIVTRVTLDIQPSFDMRQDAFEGLRWETLASELDEIMSAGYSVSIASTWSSPTVTRLWIKTRLEHGAPKTVSAEHLGAMPALSPAANPAPEAIAALNPFGVPGPWSERLPHIRHGAEPDAPGHVQSEYMLPRVRATEAIAKLRGIGAKIDEHLLVSAIRSVAGDALWLSPSYGQNTICFHFSWKRHLKAVEEITAEIEELLLPLGARPHWGKIIHARAARLAPLYPKLSAFRDLVRWHDPDGKFRNEFLDTHVFG